MFFVTFMFPHFKLSFQKMTSLKMDENVLKNPLPEGSVQFLPFRKMETKIFIIDFCLF